MDTIVGMFWNKNEADILEYTLDKALKSVDSLFIADDGSTDRSWEIIESFAKQNASKVEHIQCKPNKSDPAQRVSVFNEIRRRYKPENTWVQIIESDICILDTDIKEAIATHAVDSVGMGWHMLNAVRKAGEWTKEIDTYPNWTMPINELMPWGHWTEVMTYTFRPLPDLYYIPGIWRPWPSGFSRYTSKPVDSYRKRASSPLLAHYGFRGPTHFYNKYKHMGKRHRKYTNWNIEDRESILETVPYFNGSWNTDVFEMGREGWIDWLRRRGGYEN